MWPSWAALISDFSTAGPAWTAGSTPSGLPNATSLARVTLVFETSRQVKLTSLASGRVRAGGSLGQYVASSNCITTSAFAASFTYLAPAARETAQIRYQGRAR